MRVNLHAKFRLDSLKRLDDVAGAPSTVNRLTV